MIKQLKSLGLLLLLVAGSATAGIYVAQWFSPTKPVYISGDYSTQRSAAGSDIVLIGTAWCPYCKQARDYLKFRGLDFADLDIEQSRQAHEWLESLNAPAVPVLLIGDRQIRGFRPEAIDQALMALKPHRPSKGG